MSSHPGQPTAIDLLLESPERLEPGLVVLDGKLRLDAEVEVDALLRDTLGYPIVVLLARGEVSAELARIAAASGALARGRFLLERMYADKGLEAAMRPRFVLLAARFPDHAPALLEMLAGVEIHALEYRVVSLGGGRSVLDLASFHRTSGPSLAYGAGGAWRVEGTARGSAPRPASGPPAARATGAIGAGAVGAVGATGGAAAPRNPAPAPGPQGAPADGRTGGGPSAAAPTGGPSAPRSGAGPAGSGGGGAGHLDPDLDGELERTLHADLGELQLLEDERSDRRAKAGRGRDGSGGPAGAATSGRTPDLASVHTSDHTPDHTPDLARGLFLRARDSIRALSSHVIESHEKGAVRYRVADRTLATLTLDAAGFRLGVGEPGRAAERRVTDEGAFNDGLNEVFELYFSELGPDRPSA